MIWSQQHATFSDERSNGNLPIKGCQRDQVGGWFSSSKNVPLSSHVRPLPKSEWWSSVELILTISGTKSRSLLSSIGYIMPYILGGPRNDTQANLYFSIDFSWMFMIFLSFTLTASLNLRWLQRAWHFPPVTLVQPAESRRSLPSSSLSWLNSSPNLCITFPRMFPLFARGFAMIYPCQLWLPSTTMAGRGGQRISCSADVDEPIQGFVRKVTNKKCGAGTLWTPDKNIGIPNSEYPWISPITHQKFLGGLSLGGRDSQNLLRVRRWGFVWSP